MLRGKDNAMRGLEGRVLVVAGGAGAIGPATAKRLGEERAKVVVADKNEPGARQAAKEVTAAGGTAVGGELRPRRPRLVCCRDSGCHRSLRGDQWATRQRC